MTEKRNPPRTTQKIEADSIDRMARVSTHGMEPLAKPGGKPRDSQLAAPHPRTLARTVRRVDLPGMNQAAGPDEEDWGEMTIADGSGGVADEELVIEEPAPPAAAPTTSRVATVDDPLTMAMLAEVARSSKTGDFEPIQLDEAQRKAQGAPPTERGDQTPPRPHPRIKRRGT